MQELGEGENELMCFTSLGFKFAWLDASSDQIKVGLIRLLVGNEEFLSLL